MGIRRSWKWDSSIGASLALTQATGRLRGSPGRRCDDSARYVHVIRSGLNPDGIYEYRAWVKHPLLTINGVEKRLP